MRRCAAIRAHPACIRGTVKDFAELLGRTLVVVAHPDDEVIGCGALLQRMREPIVVFCTDGAPRPARWWQKYGSRAAYSQLRREEARQALSYADVKNFEFLAAANSELFADQELFKRLPEAVKALESVAERYKPEAMLTHAYEGGHPDHDACCFVTSMVAPQMGVRAWEMPLYRRQPDGISVKQQFVQRTGQEIEVHVTADEVERKRRMVQAYPSQGDIISAFDATVERVRPMYDYDFSQPPHAGKLNYEMWQWEMTGREVAGAFAEYSKSMAKVMTSR